MISAQTTSSTLHWLPLPRAQRISLWSGDELRDYAKRGLLVAEWRHREWYFEPEGFFHALREELALEDWHALKDTARHYDISHRALVELITSRRLEACHAEVDWYIEHDDFLRIPMLIEGCHIHADATSMPSQGSLEAFMTSQEPHHTDWITFRDAVYRHDFTHAELHQAVRASRIASKRNAQGRLLVHVQSLLDYIPPESWLALDPTASTSRQRRQLLRQLQCGHLEGRLMGGIWYVPPHILRPSTLETSSSST